MDSLVFSQDTPSSQKDVISRIIAHGGSDFAAHLRVLVVDLDGKWVPACARIDVAKKTESVFPRARPTGRLRLLTEIVELSELKNRLAAAFIGDPFLVAGQEIAGHGMDTTWVGMHYLNDWQKFEVPVPVFHLYPGEIKHSVYLPEVIETDDANLAYDGLNDCIQSTMGFASSGQGSDTRFHRFQIIEWDYRGRLVIRQETSRRTVIDVDPAGSLELKLSYVAHHGTERTSRSVENPSSEIITTDHPLSRINATLRHLGARVCEAHVDVWDVAPDASSQASPPSLTEQLLFDFMANKDLADITSDDYLDFEAAVRGRSIKGALVLGGAILEAIIQDVLKRNESRAGSYHQSGNLHKLGLADMIAVAGKIRVNHTNGLTKSLLSPLTVTAAKNLVKYRDLIHPEAHLRARSPIDFHTVQVTQGLLGSVIRDFKEAHSTGLPEEWAKDNVAPPDP